MLLKRNLLTILYSILFVLAFGIGFLETARLAILETHNTIIIACIFVLGIAIYLIVAFFIKEGRYLDRFQTNSLFYNLLEVFFLLFICATLYFLTLGRGAENAVLIVLMLASIYSCARILGGRLGGSFALVLGFFFLLSMVNAFFDSQEFVNSLCFLIPYAAFLFVTKYIVKKFAKRRFLLFCSYAALGIPFSLAIAINPFVCALFIGCILSLIFGVPEQEDAAKLAKGPFAAIIIVLFAAAIYIAGRYFVGNISLFPTLDFDSRLLAFTDAKSLVEFILLKYNRAMQYIYRPFTISFFPAVMMFFGCVAGYFAIRKKESGIGPFCLTYLILLAYYIASNELGTHFYYLTYFLPLFAAYGIYATLVLEEKPIEADSVPEEILQQNENLFIPEAEPVIQESLEEEENEAVEENETKTTENPNRWEESMAKDIQEDISLNANRNGEWETSEIPEWTISSDFYDTKKQEEKQVEEFFPEEHSEEELSVTPNIQKPVEAGENVIEVAELGSDALNTEKHYVIDSPEILESEQVEEKKDESYMPDYNRLSEDEVAPDLTDYVSPIQTDEKDEKLDDLLERLDISENIRRMKESATEDMADVIEREEEREELLTAIPTEEFDFEPENLVDISLDEKKLEPAKEDAIHSLPKYEKPDFDFSMEPLSQSLQNHEPVISEYDRVPTINDLERKWRELNGTTVEPEPSNLMEEFSDSSLLEKEPVILESSVPSEELVPDLESMTSEEELVTSEKAVSVEELQDMAFMESPKESMSGFAYSLDDVSKTLEEVSQKETIQLEEDFKKEEMLQSVEKFEEDFKKEEMLQSVEEFEEDFKREEMLQSVEELGKEEVLSSEGDFKREETLHPVEELGREEMVPSMERVRGEERTFHTEEVVRRTPAGKRSYHKITLG